MTMRDRDTGNRAGLRARIMADLQSAYRRGLTRDAAWHEVFAKFPTEDDKLILAGEFREWIEGQTR